MIEAKYEDCFSVIFLICIKLQNIETKYFKNLFKPNKNIVINPNDDIYIKKNTTKMPKGPALEGVVKLSTITNKQRLVSVSIGMNSFSIIKLLYHLRDLIY
jgi:hypothetical protein